MEGHTFKECHLTASQESQFSVVSKYGSVQLIAPPPTPIAKSVTLRQTVVAYIVTLVSMFAFCLNIVAVQLLDGSMPQFELNAWRFLAQTLIALPALLRKGGDFHVPRAQWVWVCLVVLLYFSYNLTFYGAATYLAAGMLGGLNNSIMVAGNACMSVFVKRERTASLYVAAAVAIIGTVLMLQPSFLFAGANLPLAAPTNWTSPCAVKNHIDISQPEVIIQAAVDNPEWIGYILILFSGCSDCLWYHTMGKLIQTLSPFKIAFWAGVFGIIISVMFMLILEEPMLPMSPLCIGLLIVHCLGTTQFSVIVPYCLQFLSPSVCAMINSLHLVILLMLQYTALKDIQPGKGNWVEILGGIFCLMAVLVGPLVHIYKEHSTKNKGLLVDSISDSDQSV